MLTNNTNSVQDTSDPIIYTTKDLARIMGYGKNKANNLMNSKSFPSTKFGGEWFVSKELLDQWIKKNAYKKL